MPVNKTKRKKYFTCNGSTTVFAVDFPITAETDVLAQVRTNATGAVVTLTLTTDYTLSKAGVGWDAGFNLTTVATYATGKTLIVARKVTLKQAMDLIYGDKFDSEAMEDAVDKNMMAIQEVDERVDRSVTIPISDAESLDMEVPSSVDRASKYLAFNAEGEPIVAAGAQGSGPVTDFCKTILDDETAKAVQYTLGLVDSGQEVSAFIKTLMNDTTAAIARATLDVLQDIIDVIKSSHIDWGAGADQVDLDDVPESATKKHLITTAQTIAGNKTFSGQIIDKNGNEVIAMQKETKQNTTGYTVAQAADQAISITGFSFTPTSVDSVYITFGVADNTETHAISFPCAGHTSELEDIYPVINSISFDTNQVDISIRNGHSATIYIEQVIVTACRT